MSLVHKLLRLLVLGAVLSAPVTARAADLSLVIAFDSSSSIDDRQFALQMQGTARAIRRPEVQNAIASLPSGAIDVAFVVWGDPDDVTHASPWFRIGADRDADVLAAALSGYRRSIRGLTGVGHGIDAALNVLRQAPEGSARWVINVTADGTETRMPRRSLNRSRVKQAVARAAEAGVTINALVMDDADGSVEAWFRRNVATAPGSFVMAADWQQDFEKAMVRKLVREIREPLVAAIAP